MERGRSQEVILLQRWDRQTDIRGDKLCRTNRLTPVENTGGGNAAGSSLCCVSSQIQPQISSSWAGGTWTFKITTRINLLNPADSTARQPLPLHAVQTIFVETAIFLLRPLRTSHPLLKYLQIHHPTMNITWCNQTHYRTNVVKPFCQKFTKKL